MSSCTVLLNPKIQPCSRTHHHGEIVHIECGLNLMFRGSEAIRCENGKWTDTLKCIGWYHLFKVTFY